MVVSKVVGFANGGFAIVDDNIYYATPYMKLNKEGTLQSDRVEFHRININGTEDEVIYTTSTSQENLDWSLYKIDNSVYLVLYESEKIISVNALNGKTVGSVEKSTSYSILSEDNYIHNDDRSNYNQTHIIYTRAITSEDEVYNYTGNAVCSFNIATGETKTLELSRDKTYTIKHVTRDTIYYTYTSTAIPVACLYKKAISSNWSSAQEVQLTNKAYDS